MSIKLVNGGTPTPFPGVPAVHTAERANSYDDAWEPAWITNVQTILATSVGITKTPGKVLQVGDSITLSAAYGEWAKFGAGQTYDDQIIITWMHGDLDFGHPDEDDNGWNWSASGATAWNGSNWWTGLIDDIYTDVLLNDAEFAVLMFNSTVPAPGSPPDMTIVQQRIDEFIAVGIVPILSTIPPREPLSFNTLYAEPYNAAVHAIAQANSLPVIDFYEEIVLRRPNNTWIDTLISPDGVHPTGGVGGYTAQSDPYADGGDPLSHTTGDATLNSGYLLRTWLSVQKVKEIKQKAVPVSDPLQLPLYDTSNIEYLGFFEVPTAFDTTIDGHTHNSFDHTQIGNGGIAYNPANNSLFMSGSSVDGNDGHNAVIAEIAIPEPKLAGPYNMATLIQDFVVGCDMRQADVNIPHTANGTAMTGMLVHNGRLLMTAAGWYVADGPTTASTFVRPSLSLLDTTVLGPYSITDINQRLIGNGMGCELPPNWQSTFGGNKAIIGGGGNLSTMDNANYGPQFTFFNPDDVQGSTAVTVPATPACYYTDIIASTFPFNPGFETDVWNGMSTHRGSVVLPESRTFMAYGAGGSDSFYDLGGVITGIWQGTFATQHTMNDRFYLYDAIELKDAFDGTTSALNTVYPYAVFDMDFCFVNHDLQWVSELDEPRCLAFDAVNRKGYIHERNYGVHVIKFNLPSPAFLTSMPHSISGNHTLLNASSDPVQVNGDTPWTLPQSLSQADAITYIDNRAAKGVNGIIIELIESHFAGPLNNAGDAPFDSLVPATSSYDFTDPNANYWSHIDWLIAYCASKGITCWCFPAYVGFDEGQEGWATEMIDNGTTRLTTYGEWLGARYKDYTNIVWVMGGDTAPITTGTHTDAIASGIKTNDLNHLMTAHSVRGSSAFDSYGIYGWLDFNFSYSSLSTVTSEVENDYADNLPTLLSEANYVNESGTTDRQALSQALQTITHGAVGHFLGSSPLWFFGTGWDTAIDSDGAQYYTYINRLQEARDLPALPPDYTDIFVTAGKGSGETESTVIADSTQLVAFCYSGTSLTVDFSNFDDTVNVRWYSPEDGTSQADSPATHANSGSSPITAPDSNHWILLIDLVSLSLAVP